MTELKTSHACSGCGLCMAVCAKNAIHMERGKDGFVYPKIDEALCINCDACRKICPFDEQYTAKNVTRQAYAVKHGDEIRQNSSSGGFFTALSDYILTQGGVVYGAVWTEAFQVTHIRADNRDDRNRMRGSKYVQSDLMPIYDALKNDVLSGELVLFTGTPCQCAAVTRLFEKKKPQNLWIMDFVCHGVLSQKLFDEYLADIQSKYPGKKPVCVNLRDKKFGWGENASIMWNDGTLYHSDKDYFYPIYCTHAFQRPSCFSCACTKETRFGDFTVGDFWGIQNSHSEICDGLGVSLVLANSKRGEELLEILKPSLEILEVREEDYLPYQPNLRKPTAKGDRADFALEYYQKHGYKKTMHRLFDVTLMRKINKLGYGLLKKIRGSK